MASPATSHAMDGGPNLSDATVPMDVEPPVGEDGAASSEAIAADGACSEGGGAGSEGSKAQSEAADDDADDVPHEPLTQEQKEQLVEMVAAMRKKNSNQKFEFHGWVSPRPTTQHSRLSGTRRSAAARLQRPPCRPCPTHHPRRARTRRRVTLPAPALSAARTLLTLAY